MKIKDIKRNAFLSLSIDFAIGAVAYCEQLNDMKRYVVAKQLLRSATSIGANIMEAQQAESNADFIHKLKIAAKEAAETQYWLIICEMSEGYGDPKPLLNHLDSINRMLSRIITTCKSKNRNVIGGDDSIDQSANP